MELKKSEVINNGNSSVLVVNDNQFVLGSIDELLTHYGYNVSACDNTYDAMNMLHNKHFNIVLIDVNTNEFSCIELLGKVRHHAPDVPVILMVEASNINMAVHAVKNGAFDIVPKPYMPEQLISYLQKASDHSRITKTQKGSPIYSSNAG